MTAPAYYIATVWMAPIAEPWDTTRQVIRLQATGPSDYRMRVMALWPAKTVTFGPVGRSKVQP